MMKLHFEPNLDYQRTAIEAACDLFRGQEICRTEFTVTQTQLWMGFAENDLGIGNRLQLLPEELLHNLNEIQLRNGLRPSDGLASGDFTVEMETGTGKTYVYLRTILELNKRYGFTKFVIVVPSVAIMEGVYKSLQMTEEHFRALYANAPFDFFLYDSSKLGQVRNFATSPHVQIMVVTVLPGWFKVPTPLGTYNPDGAVLVETDGRERLYFVVETKASLFADDLRRVEAGKIRCGKAHFDALQVREAPAAYVVARNFEDLMARVDS